MIAIYLFILFNKTSNYVFSGMSGSWSSHTNEPIVACDKNEGESERESQSERERARVWLEIIFITFFIHVLSMMTSRIFQSFSLILPFFPFFQHFLCVLSPLVTWSWPDIPDLFLPPGRVGYRRTRSVLICLNSIQFISKNERYCYFLLI